MFVDWEAAAHHGAAPRRSRPQPAHDRALRELVGELSALSPGFRRRWAAHGVRIRHDGAKRRRHPEVGELERTYQSRELPLSGRTGHGLTAYTAEPGTSSEDRLEVPTSWPATRSRASGG